MLDLTDLFLYFNLKDCVFFLYEETNGWNCSFSNRTYFGRVWNWKSFLKNIEIDEFQSFRREKTTSLLAATASINLSHAHTHQHAGTCHNCIQKRTRSNFTPRIFSYTHEIVCTTKKLWCCKCGPGTAKYMLKLFKWADW